MKTDGDIASFVSSLVLSLLWGRLKSGSNCKGKSKGKSKDRNQGKSKGKINSKGKGKGKPNNDKECHVCGKNGNFARDVWSRANHDKMVNEVEVENVNTAPGKEYVYTIEHEINAVNLSQDGCVEREDGREQSNCATGSAS